MGQKLLVQRYRRPLSPFCARCPPFSTRNSSGLNSLANQRESMTYYRATYKEGRSTNGTTPADQGRFAATTRNNGPTL